jgi:hypothetical protein
MIADTEYNRRLAQLFSELPCEWRFDGPRKPCPAAYKYHNGPRIYSPCEEGECYLLAETRARLGGEGC